MAKIPVVLRQKCGDFFLYLAHRSRGVEAGYYLTYLVYEKLGKVLCYLAWLLFCQVFVEGVSLVAVNLHLLETWKLRAVRVLAELVYHLVGTGARLCRLVRGEVQYLKALSMILFIQGLQVGILRGE